MLIGVDEVSEMVDYIDEMYEMMILYDVMELIQKLELQIIQVYLILELHVQIKDNINFQIEI